MTKTAVTTAIVTCLTTLMLGANGCITTGPVVPPPRPTQWSGTLSLRLVRITDGGQSRWSDAKIASYTRWVAPAFSKVNLKFDILPLEVLEKPEWYAVDNNTERNAMLVESKSRSEKRREMTVWLCDTLPVADRAGGFAYYPSNFPGSIYQHGIFLAVGSYDTALAHEIGHSLNLPHTWDDGFTDTPTANSGDCTSEPCNIMGYCGNQRRPAGGCLTRSFSDQQIAEVRKWSQYYPRNQVVKVVNPLFGAMPFYTDNTDPVID